MPNLGEVKRGRDIGKSHSTGHYIWAACLDCGLQRWVQILDIKKGQRLKMFYSKQGK